MDGKHAMDDTGHKTIGDTVAPRVGLDRPAEIGMAAEEFATPALVIDLDAFERNLEVMRGIVAASGLKLRAHAKTHKSVDVARAQVERGGAVGICCQKVAEAAVFVDGGIADVMVSNQVRQPRQIALLAELATRAKLSVCVDDPSAVGELSRACAATGATLDVLVEIDVGQERCGVRPRRAAGLAATIEAARGLRFAGLQAYNGSAQHQEDEGARHRMLGNVMAAVAEARAGLKQAGIACPKVTGAGSGSYPAEMSSGLYNELQCGSYIFMDADYRRRGGPAVEPFEHALFVLSRVMSTAVPGRATCDAGLKAMSMESGPPRVHGRSDVEYDRPSDEHGGLADPGNLLRVGDLLALVPGHCDPTCNLHDWYVGVRGGVVETLWPVSARGRLW